VGTDGDSDVPVLLCDEEWRQAYKYLTVRGTMHSNGHGDSIRLFLEDDNTRVASYGYIDLGDGEDPGFGKLGVFEGYPVRNVSAKVLFGYKLKSLGLPNLTMHLNHCYSAARVQTGWPWPECPNYPFGVQESKNGRRIIDTLAKIIKKGKGGGKVVGYGGVYRPMLEIHVTLVEESLPGNLTANDIAEIDGIVKSMRHKARNNKMQNYNGDGEALEAAIEKRVRKWLRLNVEPPPSDEQLDEVDVKVKVVVYPEKGGDKRETE
jgi:hypothetical protein